MNSGLDGKRNFCGHFSLITNGTKNRNFQNGDTVLLKTNANCNQWPTVKVMGINSDAKDFVQSVKLIGKTKNNGEQILESPIHKIVLLKESEIWFPDEMPSVKMIWHLEGSQCCYRPYVGETM